jgi:hypothetical protein
VSKKDDQGTAEKGVLGGEKGEEMNTLRCR